MNDLRIYDNGSETLIAPRARYWRDYADLAGQSVSGETERIVIARDVRVTVRALAEHWRRQADDIDVEEWSEFETEEEVKQQAVDEHTVHLLNRMAAELEDAFGLIDTESSASRQHYIDTGRYLRHGEGA